MCILSLDEGGILCLHLVQLAPKVNNDSLQLQNVFIHLTTTALLLLKVIKLLLLLTIQIFVLII